MQRGGANNPALWGGGTTLENYIPGQPFFSVDPNSHFDPSKTLLLNPKAWTDAAPGTFGVSAPYYINNRWQRQPAESISVGRNFRVREKYNLQIRAEFQKIFNRVFFALPADGQGTNSLTAPANNNPGGALSGRLRFRQRYQARVRRRAPVNWSRGSFSEVTMTLGPAAMLAAGLSRFEMCRERQPRCGRARQKQERGSCAILWRKTELASIWIAQVDVELEGDKGQEE